MNNSFIFKIIKNFVGAIILLVIVFAYVFSVPFKGLPGGIGTRMILACFGAIVLFIELLKGHILYNIKIRKDLLQILLFVFAIASLSVITCLANQTSDYYFVRFASALIFNMCAGYFVVWLFTKFYGEATFTSLSNYLIISGVVQVIISLMMFLDNNFRTSVLNVLDMGEFMETLIKSTEEKRLIPIGPNPFPVSIALGFILMLISVLMRNQKNSFLTTLFYTISFILIASIGAMIGRTTLIGGAFAILIFLLPEGVKKSAFTNRYKFLFSILIVICILFFSFFLLSQESKDSLTASSEFGFEVFYNYFSGNGVKSASTDELYTMFIWPDQLKTYIIGDGLFSSPTNPIEFYKGTDIGYLRLIYYFGIPGLLIFLIIQYLLVIRIAIKSKDHKHIYRFFMIQCLFMLVLNVKGYADILYLNILFFYIIDSQVIQESNLKIDVSHFETL